MDETGWRWSHALDAPSLVAAKAGEPVYLSSGAENRTYRGVVRDDGTVGDLQLFAEPVIVPQLGIRGVGRQRSFAPFVEALFGPPAVANVVLGLLQRGHFGRLLSGVIGVGVADAIVNRPSAETDQNSQHEGAQ